MSSKIAIVNPKTRSVIESNEPLNILALASYLVKAGLSVRIIDEAAGEDVVKAVEAFKPELVGFTATTCSYSRAVQLLKQIKPLGYLTVIGGVHASTLPEKVLADGFDMVVVGEGEKMLLDIMVRGEQSGIFRTSRQQILSNEELPFLDRRLINMDFYRRTKERVPHDFNLDFVPFGAHMACMLTSRGCPYSCIFCHNTWRGTPIRLADPETVVGEIKALIRDYGVHYIWFLDDDFFQVKQRVRRICEVIIKDKIEVYWATSSRPDSVDDETLSLAYRAGCRRIAFGFESGSQRILDVLGKRSNVQENIAVVSLCNKHRIEVGGLFMIGNPTETSEDIGLTWKFIKNTKMDSISVSVTTPFPGTKLWQMCEERGYIASDIDFSGFYYTQAPIQIPDTFSPREVEALKRRLIYKIYLLQPKIRGRFFLKFLRHPGLILEKSLEYLPFFKRPADS